MSEQIVSLEAIAKDAGKAVQYELTEDACPYPAESAAAIHWLALHQYFSRFARQDAIERQQRTEAA